jgi:hypothetical protein
MNNSNAFMTAFFGPDYSSGLERIAMPVNSLVSEKLWIKQELTVPGNCVTAAPCMGKILLYYWSMDIPTPVDDFLAHTESSDPMENTTAIS